MTNLTEKWIKGELPDGHYYVRDGENIIAELFDGYFYNEGQPITSFVGGVNEVLDKVPSFEQWQAKLEENTKLKELLKTHKLLFELEKDNTKDALQQGKYAYLINEIDQALGRRIDEQRS